MGFVIPSSRNRLYLSGADWIISTLDYMMRSSTSAGNSSQIVIRTDVCIDEKGLQKRLQEFLGLFPVISGVVSRDLSLAPYWKIPERPSKVPELQIFKTSEALSEDQILTLLAEAINRPFNRPDEHLAFHLIQSEPVGSIFAMTFDHALFDARGAETFLDLFLNWLSGADISEVPGKMKLTASADLSEWKEKFLSGRNVNRKMLALSNPPFSVLPMSQSRIAGFRYSVIPFNEDETKAMLGRALKTAGYLMEMPFLLSEVLCVVNTLFEMRGINPDNYLVPVTIDTRRGEDSYNEMFMNHVSYLFFKVNASAAADTKETIKALKQQMFDQVKSGLPKDFANASSLMRIAPRPLLARFINLPFKGNAGSFVFAYLGESRCSKDRLFGEEIADIFHMPRVTAPPGLGFFFVSFRGRMNLIMSYLDGLLTDEEVIFLRQGLAGRLKAA